jgi:Flp pilus assembly protein TadG
MTAGIELPAFALAMIVLMVLFCFAVGGGLMFLVFYSARKGYDDAVDRRVGWRDPGKG